MGKPFNYGGQAVIEGVMMRGAKNMCVAVRGPDDEIVTHCEPLDPHIYSGFVAKVPFVRGLTMLWDALGLGIRSLVFSADVAMGEEEAEFSGPVAWGTIAVSMIAAVLIFFVGPLAIVSFVDPYIGSAFVSNVLEGIIRLTFFLIYLWAIAFIPDIRRVFAYHGAEHKTINTYESGEDLTVQSVERSSTSHLRCGTAFLLQVVVISIFVFSFLGRPPIMLRIASRILLIPVIAGIAYEFLKFSAAHQNAWIMRVLSRPGLWLQRLTTREPDESMLEIAITALKQLLTKENIINASDQAEVLTAVSSSPPVVAEG